MIPKELLYNTAFSAQLPITMSSQTPLLKYFSFSRSLYPTTLTLSSMKGVCAAIKCTSGKQSSSHISIQWRRLLVLILIYIKLLNSRYIYVNIEVKRSCQLKSFIFITCKLVIQKSFLTIKLLKIVLIIKNCINY